MQTPLKGTFSPWKFSNSLREWGRTGHCIFNEWFTLWTHLWVLPSATVHMRWYIHQKATRLVWNGHFQRHVTKVQRWGTTHQDNEWQNAWDREIHPDRKMSPARATEGGGWMSSFMGSQLFKWNLVIFKWRGLSMLQANFCKLVRPWVGLVVIQAVLGPNRSCCLKYLRAWTEAIWKQYWTF